jgi:hypothetical protein
MQPRSLFGAFWVRARFLLLIGLIAFAWVGAVLAANKRTNEDRHCHTVPGVAVVRVPAGTVRYAHAQGWPRVLERDDAIGFAPAYDHSPTGDRVTGLAHRYCSWQRIRLVAREGS